MTEIPAHSEPHAVDVHVGARIRSRRKLLKLSQQSMAHALGLTFQQIQKYESGANRVSASKLHEIARFLSTPISYFFDGLPPTSPEGATSEIELKIAAFLESPEGMALVDAVPRIRSAAARRGLVELARTLASDTEG